MDKACIPGDVDNGEKLFKARCTQCHTINKVPEIGHQPSSRYLARTFIFKAPSTPLIFRHWVPFIFSFESFNFLPGLI